MRTLQHSDIEIGIIVCVNSYEKGYWLLSRVDSDRLHFYALHRLDDGSFVKKHDRDSSFIRLSSVGSDKIQFVGMSYTGTDDRIYVEPPETTKKIGKFKITRKSNG